MPEDVYHRPTALPRRPRHRSPGRFDAHRRLMEKPDAPWRAAVTDLVGRPRDNSHPGRSGRIHATCEKRPFKTSPRGELASPGLHQSVVYLVSYCGREHPHSCHSAARSARRVNLRRGQVAANCHWLAADLRATAWLGPGATTSATQAGSKGRHVSMLPAARDGLAINGWGCLKLGFQID